MNSNKLSLKSLLMLDAATCATMGVVLLLGVKPIAALTQIPAALLFWAGASLMPIAAFMALSARAVPVPAWAVSVVILGNAMWVVASILLPLAGLIVPNPLGWAFLVGQAGVVAILAKLEFDASRGRAIAA
jgi:hypothetical protein